MYAHRDALEARHLCRGGVVTIKFAVATEAAQSYMVVLIAWSKVVSARSLSWQNLESERLGRRLKMKLQLSRESAWATPTKC
jgi:hypothetical protein